MVSVQVSDVTESRLLNTMNLTAANHPVRFCAAHLLLLRNSFMSTMSKKRTIDAFFTPPAKQRKVDEPNAQEVSSVCLSNGHCVMEIWC